MRDCLARSTQADEANQIFIRVAERGLREELALEYGEYDIALLGFAVATERHQWAALFSAQLRSLTAPELRERHSRGISDRWEHKVLEYVTFEPRTVVKYLIAPDRIGSWAACAPLLFYFSLVYQYGHQEVEKVARQVLHELGVREPRRRGLRILHVFRAVNQSIKPHIVVSKKTRDSTD